MTPAIAADKLPDPNEQRVREHTLARLQANAEHFLETYASRFGNVLNADDAATLFDEYNQDRMWFRVAVHPAATWIRDELFRRALAEEAPPDLNRVAFTAGANAAGKSTALDFTDERNRAVAVLDTTLSNREHARQLVDQARRAGKEVSILYVRRPLEESFSGMLERAEREGRVVTIEQLINSDRGAADTVRDLWEQFGKDPDFQFRFFDNSGAGTREAFIDLAASRDYTEIRKRLYELLDQEYRSGRITEARYRRIRGDREGGEPPRGGRGGPPNRGGLPQAG